MILVLLDLLLMIKRLTRCEYVLTWTACADNFSYVFGGATNDTFDTIYPNDDAYRDVYILTLPAFTWVRTGQLSEERRDGMSCLVIGKSQMLVVGGNFFADAAKIKIDPWPNGMGIFDLNALEWTNGNYNHSAAPYQRAASVQAIYQQE